MRILGVSREESLRGIPFHGVGSVRNALQLFMSGSTKGSQATGNRLMADGGLGGVVALMNKEELEAPHKDSFLGRMFDQIDAALAAGRRFNYHYDYDGVGPFFKTTVEVEALRGFEELYLLHLSAAYVGDAVEVGLAEAIGAERGLMGVSVRIELAPEGDHFEIDFDDILGHLASAGLNTLSAEQVIVALMEDAAVRPLKSRPAPRLRDDEYRVSLYPALYTVGSAYGPAAVERPWSSQGGTLFGPLWDDNMHSPESAPEWRNPVVVLHVSEPYDEDNHWDRQPVIDPTRRQTIRDIASQIEACFQ